MYVYMLLVIDLLDDYKKGNSHMNIQARESNRYLDQKLLETKLKEITATASYLRTQRIGEKLSDWSQAEAYWIGEKESKSSEINALLLSDHEESTDDEDTESVASDSSSDSDALIAASRRTRDEESDSESSDEEEEVYDYEDLEENNSDDEAYTFDDVPIKYQQIISCLLHYHSELQQENDKPEKLVLVTNDEDLTYWVEFFGDPKTGKKLLVKTVNEWDRLVTDIDFERSYEYTWRHR